MTFILSTDADFVSDTVLRCAYKPFMELPLTVFMTGISVYLDEQFRSHPMWEAEAHPNFCAGSIHGATESEVFQTIEQFSGEKIGFRCHRYFSSNDVEERFAEMGYGYASNICTDLATIMPFRDRCGIIQFPIFMEDGGYLKYHGVPQIENIIRHLNNENADVVFNFHPIHLALNTADFSVVLSLKKSLTAEQYRNLSVADITKYRNKKYGISDFLYELLEFADRKKIEITNLKQSYEKYKTICV